MLVTEKHKLLYTGMAVLAGRSEKPRLSGISEYTDGWESWGPAQMPVSEFVLPPQSRFAPLYTEGKKNMCVCVCIYMFVYIHIPGYMCVHICIYIYVYIVVIIISQGCIVNLIPNIGWCQLRVLMSSPS